jgi:hypothetical protein
LQTPNQVLSAADATRYFPTLDESVTESPVFQDMLDDAMALINETIGLDLSNGPGVEVTQTFQPDATANSMIRMVVPMDQEEPVTVQSGPDQRIMNSWEYTRYVNMIRAGGVWSNYYFFDRGHSFNTNFPAPVTVTYTPRDTVFRMVKQVMLDLVRLRLMQQNMDTNLSPGGFASITSIEDDAQKIEFASDASGPDFDTLQQSILAGLLLKLRGPRIG